jgi:hypothetical protein
MCANRRNKVKLGLKLEGTKWGARLFPRFGGVPGRYRHRAALVTFTQNAGGGRDHSLC